MILSRTTNKGNRNDLLRASFPDHIMEQAKMAAAEDKVSVNQIFVSFIAEGLGHRRD